MCWRADCGGVSKVNSARRGITWWQQWVDHPEKLWLRQVCFQLHLWIGVAMSAYVFLMSLSGSVIVFRNELSPTISMEWLVHVHGSLLAGSPGHVLNAIGAFCLLLLSLTGAIIWWPGRAHWRRSLTIEWSARFPRITWDAHSAFGFWFLVFVTMWGVSGLYLSEPQVFDVLLRFDPADRVVDRGLSALAAFHFGRFNRMTQVVWALVGLVPAVLASTGIFICCRRVMFNKPSNPKSAGL
jgi:uncharacterized iron-regulated membrane protein